MGFYDLAFLPRRHEVLGLAHDFILVGGKQGHVHCRILLLQQILFVSVDFSVVIGMLQS